MRPINNSVITDFGRNHKLVLSSGSSLTTDVTFSYTNNNTFVIRELNIIPYIVGKDDKGNYVNMQLGSSVTYFNRIQLFIPKLGVGRYTVYFLIQYNGSAQKVQFTDNDSSLELIVH